jgi:hypothetical protein
MGGPLEMQKTDVFAFSAWALLELTWLRGTKFKKK